MLYIALLYYCTAVHPAGIVFTSFLSTIIRPSCQGLFNYNLFALLCYALRCFALLLQLCTLAGIVFTSFLSTSIRPSSQGLFNYNLLFALCCFALFFVVLHCFGVLCLALLCFCFCFAFAFPVNFGTRDGGQGGYKKNHNLL